MTIAVADEVVALVVDLWHPGLTAAECDKITAHFPARLLPEDSEERVLSVLCSPSLSLEVASHMSGDQMALAAQSCMAWREISMDEDLWRLFCTREGETSSKMESWRSTYIDLLAASFDAPLANYISKKDEGNCDYTCKILLVGGQGVGKSSYMVRLGDDRFEDRYIRTIGVDFRIRMVQCCKQQVKLQIWDMIYRNQFHNLGCTIDHGVHIVLLMYDMTVADTSLLMYHMEQIRKYARDDVVVGLVGCKSDLEHDREVSAEEGAALAAAWGVFFVETSSLTGKNVERAAARGVSEWLKLVQQSEKTPTNPSTNSKCVLC